MKRTNCRKSAIALAQARAAQALWMRATRLCCTVKTRLRNGTRAFVQGEQGQGTTEYAILVGVLVVIAIIAIVAFRGRIQELWDAIANGINGL